MKVSVVIINYNTFQLTCNCIASVMEYTKQVDYEIILVDNASTECNPKLFKEKFPQVVLVESKINGGFAKGNNWGIEQSSGEYILLLNSDTYLKEDSISIAANTLENNNQIGVVGARMVYPDGKLQYSARKFRGIQWELLDFFRFLLLALPYRKRAVLMLGKYFKADFNTFSDWVNGAFFMLPKQFLHKLPDNKLNERFFMYGEDQLWCYQFNQLGFKSYFLADTTIIHIANASTNPNKILQLILTIIKNELEIMKIRKGKGFYYYCFCSVYLAKEYSRYAIKYLLFKFSGRLLR